MATGDTFQIHVTNCTTKLNARIHEMQILWCNSWQGAGQAYAAELEFFTRQALPLRNRRILRLAQSSPMVVRSPARRQRDDRAMSGKMAGRSPRVMSAQLPGSGRSMAAAMPPNVRQDGSQDNLFCAGRGRAMSAPETCETTRNLAAQLPGNGRSVATAMPHDGQSDDSQDSLPCGGRGRAMSTLETCETTRKMVAHQPYRVRAMASATSRKQFVGFSLSAFKRDLQKS
jgi:hypothetical protein